MIGAGCRVPDAGCRVQEAGCRVQGAGCRVLACIPLAVMAIRNEELFGPSSGMLTHPGLRVWGEFRVECSGSRVS